MRIDVMAYFKPCITDRALCFNNILYIEAEKMREIKFRAWFEVHKRMVYNLGFNENSFKNFDDTADLTCVWDKDLTDEDGKYEATFNFKIMQFTGLYDKNGKEIYEGDILGYKKSSQKKWVSGESERVLVSWHEKESRFISEFYTVYGGEGYCGYIIPQQIRNLIENNWVVIGNIYENQELING